MEIKVSVDEIRDWLRIQMDQSNAALARFSRRITSVDIKGALLSADEAMAAIAIRDAASHCLDILVLDANFVTPESVLYAAIVNANVRWTHSTNNQATVRDLAEAAFRLALAKFILGSLP